MLSQDGSEQLSIDVLVTNGIYAAGVLLLARWLITTSLGRKALVNAPPRRNRMSPIVPLIPLSLWFIGAALLQPLVHQLIRPHEQWQEVFLDTVGFCAPA